MARVVGACVVPFLLLAFAVLYLRPDLSGERFAWKIQPNFTPFWMGTGYLRGAWFFTSVVRARRSHEVALGFLPMRAFVWAMLGVTVLHWARFDLHHLRFQLWLILYRVTPLLVPALWPFNRRHEPVRPEDGTTLVPTRVHGLMGLICGRRPGARCRAPVPSLARAAAKHDVLARAVAARHLAGLGRVQPSPAGLPGRG